MGYPTTVQKNQFGEQSNNFIVGGSGQIQCNFIVDPANGNGLGIRSLKNQNLPGVASVYMHTSSTPAAGNPNPPPGYILVEFTQGYSGYVTGTSGFIGPLSGTPINVTSGLTAGNVYVIASVGTTTQSQWAALGLPPGNVPAVGAAFVAITSSAGSGTGVVEAIAPTGSGIDHIEAVGDPNQTCGPAGGQGGSMLLVCLGATASGTTTLQPTAAAVNTVIGLTFVMTENAEAPLN